jgi:hypothetical protein
MELRKLVDSGSEGNNLGDKSDNRSTALMGSVE